jgi:hypothetical protein
MRPCPRPFCEDRGLAASVVVSRLSHLKQMCASGSMPSGCHADTKRQGKRSESNCYDDYPRSTRHLSPHLDLRCTPPTQRKPCRDKIPNESALFFIARIAIFQVSSLYRRLHSRYPLRIDRAKFFFVFIELIFEILYETLEMLRRQRIKLPSLPRYHADGKRFFGSCG